ncbi:tripartite tricarboxylate transporter TctB family protein [Orenia metallireducens]|uniref:Tripartite tricarboxylate transporter TctB family protein n=1 Tax=Orenia metallireducens TaxID=1413210 RepID=A0A285H2R8_9FIRM|nr:tripartite tricarboxylate transporter TctB family protein [Orenia metallireducens]PRX21792.1 tripartite tricarboxylate transporter TctB family protein [Orenia metallireducens]SNY29046.1 Tripartite tricarboxylate transporter TctB family protein [Orenia metallireducens]
MAKKRIGFGIFLILFCTIAYIMTYSIPQRVQMEVSAAFFPRVVLIALAVSALLVIIGGLKEYRLEKVQIKKEEKGEFHYKLLVLSLINCLGYGILLKPLGFVFTSSVFLILQMWLMTADITKKIFIRNTILSITVVVALYVLFTTVFYVPLP